MAALIRAALLLVGSAVVAGAQGSRSRALTVSAFGQHVDQRDERASPRSYGGYLPGLAIAYGHGTARSTTSGELSFAAGQVGATPDGKADIGSIALRAEHVWWLSPILGAGVDVSGELRVFDVEYARASDEVFDNRSVALSPMLWFHPYSDPATDVKLYVTALSAYHWTYSRGAVGGSWRIGLPHDWRNVRLDMGHTLNPWDRVALRVGYRITARSVASAPSLTFIENRVSVSGLVRLAD